MHSCPDCGQACDCKGDIEDTLLDDDYADCDHECWPEDGSKVETVFQGLDEGPHAAARRSP